MRKSDDEAKHISVYTTRVDTVYGMTYAVLAPDHPRVEDFIVDEYRAEVDAYILESKNKSDQDRTQADKDKTGVFTGSYVTNPFNGESVPLYVGDYVLGHYGTGAVMAVPAHDERDFAFAKKYHLPIVQSVDVGVEFSSDAWKVEYANDGTVLVTGRDSDTARREFANEASEYGF